eukprot:CAMPEP_0185461964 /NCGR_PEP_ID=MMETSP1365-20130426/91241_1 /TAXON_ID=38817 /ORGANISM="Gephyrocapsa oceanica, Strain RCC1303" /LENGTH=307 /DNA_ID=CAMNT_0028068635 /DNA_START=79 /DNA_END=1003 /DNA_ORIENTATION=-
MATSAQHEPTTHERPPSVAPMAMPAPRSEAAAPATGLQVTRDVQRKGTDGENAVSWLHQHDDPRADNRGVANRGPASSSSAPSIKTILARRFLVARRRGFRGVGSSDGLFPRGRLRPAGRRVREPAVQTECPKRELVREGAPARRELYQERRAHLQERRLPARVREEPVPHFDPNVRPPFEHRGLYVKRGQMRGLVESTTLTSRTCVELDAPIRERPRCIGTGTGPTEEQGLGLVLSIRVPVDAAVDRRLLRDQLHCAAGESIVVDKGLQLDVELTVRPIRAARGLAQESMRVLGLQPPFARVGHWH